LITALASGAVVGFLPMGIVALVAPGFAPAWIGSFAWIFQHRTMNLCLPVPWPWSVETAGQTAPVVLVAVATGSMLLAAPAAYAVTAWNAAASGSERLRDRRSSQAPRLSASPICTTSSRGQSCRILRIQPCVIGAFAMAAAGATSRQRAEGRWLSALLALLTVGSIGLFRVADAGRQRLPNCFKEKPLTRTSLLPVSGRPTKSRPRP
jgi:hypothetical protein